jgi:hypothetical protein
MPFVALESSVFALSPTKEQNVKVPVPTSSVRPTLNAPWSMESQSACVTRATNPPELAKLAASTSTSVSADPVVPELSVRTPLVASDANAPLDHLETQM